MELELTKLLIESVDKASDETEGYERKSDTDTYIQDHINEAILKTISKYINDNATVTVEFSGKVKIVYQDPTISTSTDLAPVISYRYIEIKEEDNIPITGEIKEVEMGESVSEWLDNLGIKMHSDLICEGPGRIIIFNDPLTVFDELKISNYTDLYNPDFEEAKALDPSDIKYQVWLSISKGIFKAIKEQSPPKITDIDFSLSEDYMKDGGYLDLIDKTITIKNIELK